MDTNRPAWLNSRRREPAAAAIEPARRQAFVCAGTNLAAYSGAARTGDHGKLAKAAGHERRACHLEQLSVPSQANRFHTCSERNSPANKIERRCGHSATGVKVILRTEQFALT